MVGTERLRKVAWGKGGPRGRTGRLLTGTGAAVSTTSSPWGGGAGVQTDAEGSAVPGNLLSGG